MKKLKTIYIAAISFAVLFAIVIYGIAAENLTETIMINMSFIWVPMIVFGASGLVFINKKRPVLLSILWSIFSFFLMIVFFSIIWPLL
ncbi:MAG: hypothetical protein ACD_51C00314G0005 [uncultured bacterium]|nr:MAG: hypothetical protein ACD_51C00314G0005 [uncultured bacterium]OGJ47055.1 MAG: hypothetical protein A2244_04940 [Candidatus Peregrinibacteria bacterium RIFOXYA2_FULL_41_18]OGJ49743.1 MAG: hypothetical protein A2344_03600 [Candidatus Peregrinibacteria bacterium RIFOXYB12_FULL_41_12]OGJ52731.1 MAG: hypothetical protein A2336_05105 [Candidatus Peregrinibacteria bacterium RIFOXYB2_FULL_41_88]